MTFCGCCPNPTTPPLEFPWCTPPIFFFLSEVLNQRELSLNTKKNEQLGSTVQIGISSVCRRRKDGGPIFQTECHFYERISQFVSSSGGEINPIFYGIFPPLLFAALAVNAFFQRAPPAEPAKPNFEYCSTLG